MTSAAFVISLERSQLRFKHNRPLPRIPLPGEILPAVDGRALTAQQTNTVYVRCLHKPMYPFVLGPGEIGCFLSHRKAWQEISQRKLDAGLVLEDDVSIDDAQLAKSLELLQGANVREMPTSSYRSDRSGRSPGQWLKGTTLELYIPRSHRSGRPGNG